MATACFALRLEFFQRDVCISLLLPLLFLMPCLNATPQGLGRHASSTATSTQEVSNTTQAGSEGPPNTFVDLTPAELAKEIHELKQLRPAESQEILPKILEGVGATVAAFFNDFSNTTCTERVHSTIDTSLEPVPLHYNATFNYLALVKEGAGKTNLQEFRTDSKGNGLEAQSQDAVVITGFVAMSAHFHPDLQPDSRFRYVGREVVKGQDTYVVAFAQRPEVARYTGRVVFHDKSATVFRQGVAWIDPVSFTILRLRTDILHPELNVGMQRETTEVEYSEVTFQRGAKKLWLPSEVTVTGQLNHYSFHTQHLYSDYRFFNVQTEEKQQGP